MPKPSNRRRRPRRRAAVLLIAGTLVQAALTSIAAFGADFSATMAAAERTAAAAAATEAATLHNWAADQLRAVATLTGYPTNDPRLAPWQATLDSATQSLQRWSGYAAARQPAPAAPPSTIPAVDPKLRQRGAERLAKSGALAAADALNAPATALNGAQQALRTLDFMIDQRTTLRLIEQGRLNRQNALIEQARLAQRRIETERRIEQIVAPLYAEPLPAGARLELSTRLLAPQPFTDTKRRAIQHKAASDVAAAARTKPDAFGALARDANPGAVDFAELARQLEIWVEQHCAEHLYLTGRMRLQPQLIHDAVLATQLTAALGADLGGPAGLSLIQNQVAQVRAAADRLPPPRQSGDKAADKAAIEAQRKIQTDIHESADALVAKLVRAETPANSRR
jgi:hypothetical protein